MRSRPTRVGIATAAVACLLATAEPAGAATAHHAPGPGTIAVVPLDDRPVNTVAPAATASVAGFRTVLPPREELGRFTTPGDGEAIGQWLEHTHADGYVVSTSMLAYGGLIASRTGTPTIEGATANVQAIKRLRARNPHAPIEVFDTIQRLALSSIGGDYDKYAALVRQWAQLYDQVVNLGQEEHRAELDQVRAQIPDEVITNYLKARDRNSAINELMVRWVADGTIDHLVLGQDDTAEYGFSRAERVKLQALADQLHVTDKVQIFPGADEIDALLVSRLVRQRLGVQPTFSVEYSGEDASAWIPGLEDRTFDQNIALHVKAVGGTMGGGDGAIHLMVNTPPASGHDHTADLDLFVAEIKKRLDAGQPVIVVDPLYVNKADHELIQRMEQRLPVTHLLSYSGWNTAGNALGLALAQGTSREAYLVTGARWQRPVTAAAQASYLLKRFAIDDVYKNSVQPLAYQEAASHGYDPYNFTAEQWTTMQDWVAARLVPQTQQLFDDTFAGRDLPAGPGTSVRIQHLVGLSDILPWPRLFETQLSATVTVSPFSLR